MVKPIVRDPLLLSRKSIPATSNDRALAVDLMDTLSANAQNCVGMAANMIGENKCAIVVNMGLMNVVMFNPVLLEKRGAYEAEEGCLSLDGVRKATRYREIEVEYRDVNFKLQRRSYSGFIAQIIQHEIDHCAGILI